MSRLYTKLLVVIAAGIFSGVVFADDLTIPNTFTAGTPARAAEVNDNFTAVEASVDDNAAEITTNAGSIVTNTAVGQANASAIATNGTAILGNTASITALTSGSGVMVYSQGAAIGRFLSVNGVEWIWVLSDTGFIFSIGTEPDPNHYLGKTQIFFSELNCLGNAFVGVHPRGAWAFAVGAVVMSDSSLSPLYYTPRGSVRMAGVPYQSITTGGSGCANVAGVQFLHAAFPNDEAITGVPNTAPIFPLTLGSP